MGWLAHFFGLDTGAGFAYLFWSGIGSDIGEVTLVAGAVTFYYHHTCHVDHCWRIAKHAHTQDGVEYKLCRKHHPAATKLTAAAVRPSNASEPPTG